MATDSFLAAQYFISKVATDPDARMDPEFKALWVAALRSGEYIQGQSTLHSDNGEKHCCLGVACIIFREQYPDIKFFDAMEQYLPKVVQDKIQVSLVGTIPGCKPKDLLHRSVSDMNDAGFTFDDIADIIEEHF